MAVQAPDTELGRTGRLVPVMTFIRVACRLFGSLVVASVGSPEATKAVEAESRCATRFVRQWPPEKVSHRPKLTTNLL